MSSLMDDLARMAAVHVAVSTEELAVDLQDGRTIIAPVGWYPRLAHATVKERANWQLIGNGCGIHWPDLDEDISIRNLVLGQKSGESQASLKKWLAARPGKKRSK